MKTIKSEWDKVCTKYTKKFCDIMEFDITDGYWIGDDVGELLDIADYTFSMDVIRYVVDNEVKPEEVFEWYDYCLRLGIIEVYDTPNLRSWCLGCPRLSEEEIVKKEKAYADAHYNNNQCN